MKNTFLLLCSAIILSCWCCTPRQLTKVYDEAKVKIFYGKSISDTAKPDEDEISGQLTAIRKDNQALKWKSVGEKDYVLVSTWTKDTTFYNTRPNGVMQFNTGIGELWVTVVPELQKMCQEKSFGRKEGLDLRLKQLIGLPPTTTKTHFVELWVESKDLFRPCPDSEIDDSSCNLCFSENTDSTYINWINDLRIKSYHNCNWNWNYPWTQLGYTYDWNPKNKTHQGLSEFIVKQNSDILVNGVYSTEEYCQDSK